MRKLIDISCSFRTLSWFPLDTIIQVRKASLYSFMSVYVVVVVEEGLLRG